MSEDLIRRSDAIKAFVEETNGVNVEKAIREVDAYLKIRECDEVWDSIRAIRDCLECAKDEIAEYIPSADRPQGEWVKRTHDTLIAQVNFAYCSECGQPIMHEHTRPLWNFCPNCGARMFAKDINVPDKKGAGDD